MAGESRTQDNVNKSRTVLDIPGQLEPMWWVKLSFGTYGDDESKWIQDAAAGLASYKLINVKE